jgi:hypothetical protein
MKLQNVMDKLLKKNERRAPNRLFTTRPEIRDTVEDHVEDGSANFDTQNITKYTYPCKWERE